MTAHPTAATPRAAALAGDGLLRLALKADAAVTGANGLAYLALAGPLDDLLGVPASFLRVIGVVLVAFAAAVYAVGSRPAISRAAALAVAEVNVAWVAGSLAMLGAGWHDPSTAGSVWIALQAGTVALFAALQLAGRRRAG